MRCFVSILAWSLVSACGSEELDARQEKLIRQESKVEELRARVQEIQSVVQSVEQGNRHAQHDPSAAPPRSADLAPHPPAGSLEGAIRVTSVRTGTPPALPLLGQPSQAEEPCGWAFEVPEIRAISDLALRKSGLGRASPVTLLEDGRSLTAHASNDNHVKRCAGAFRHAGNLLQFSPRGHSEAALSRAYRLSLDERVPLPRGDDGRPLYWVYPGTQLEITFTGVWPPDAPPPEVTAVLKLTGEAQSSPSVQAHWSQPQLLEGDTPVVRFPVSPEALQDGWSLHLYSPLEGPYIVFDTLVLGNASHGLTVTREPASD